MRSRLVVLGLVGFTLLAPSAHAADPVLLVAEFNVRPDKETQFLDLIKKYDAPMLNQLMAEGAVRAWGLDTTMLHDPSGPTHHLWFVSPDLAALDKVVAAEEALSQKFEADDQKAAAQAKAAGKPAPKKTMAQIFESHDLTKHRDMLFRVLVSGGAPAPAGAKPYIFVNFAKVQPGKSGDFRTAWEKYIKPVNEKLLADGTVLGYGVAAAAPRTGEFTHCGWVTVPTLAARDKYQAAMDARSAGEQKEAAAAFLQALDGDATRGLFLRSLIYETAPPTKK